MNSSKDLPVQVSIIVPIYNSEKYLHRCIQSVLSQKGIEIEVILAVDGGEACYKICEKYQKENKNIKIIKDQGSYGKSVNAGILQASGEYVGIVEADDWCSDQMFSYLYNEAKKYDADVVKGGWIDAYDDEAKNKERGFKVQDGLLDIEKNPSFFAIQPSVWSAIYRKKYLLDKSIFFMESKQAYVDAPFHYQSIYDTSRFVVVNKVFYYYYQDNEMQSIASKENILDGINAETYAYCKIIKNRDICNKFWKYIFSAMLEHMIWNDKRISVPASTIELRTNIKKFISSLDLSEIYFLDLHRQHRDFLLSIDANLIRKFKDPSQPSRISKLRLFDFIDIFSIKEYGDTLLLYILFIKMFTIKRYDKKFTIKFFNMAILSWDKT